MKRYRAKRDSKFYDVDGDEFLLIANGDTFEFNPDDFEEVEEEEEIQLLDTDSSTYLNFEKAIAVKLNEVIEAHKTLQKEVNSLIGNVADHEQEIGKLKVSNNIPKYTCTKCHRSYSNLAEHTLMCPNR